MDTQLTDHAIVSRDIWVDARKALLLEEKALTHQIETISRKRRELPWVKINKDYSFDTVAGKKTLKELFEGRSQLIVYHFMYHPDWEEGCHGCSFVSDHVDGARQHFENHDVKFVAVSRAPQAKLQAFKKRMHWQFDWVSSQDSDFNYDYHVSFHKPHGDEPNVMKYNYETVKFAGEEQPGLSVFVTDDSGNLFHTYSTYARGLDILLGTHNFLDLTPMGRNENSTMDWVRHHDKYDAKTQSSCCNNS